MKEQHQCRRAFRLANAIWVYALGLAAPAASAALPQEVSLQHRGMVALPTGAQVGGIGIEELSGITYDRDADIFLAVNDSSGVGRARIYTFSLSYDAAGITAVEPLESGQLRYANGDLLPSVDAEGLALGQNRNLYVSHEGRAVTSPADSRDPWVWEFDADTLRRTQALPMPEKFLPRDADGQPVPTGNAAQATGVRRNLGFECLSLCPTERYLYTATEAALLQDDSRAPFDGELNQAHQSDSRILRYQRDADGLWQPGPEKIYRSDQGTLYLWFVYRFNTVPSILAIDGNGRMLVMERGLTANNLNTGSYRIRIYEVDFNQGGTTDVSSYPSLLAIPSPLVVNRLSKRLVWQSSSGMDNVEGMAWGRDIDGYRSLVLVSDNNSSAAQETQFHVLLSNIPAHFGSHYEAWLHQYFTAGDIAQGIGDPLQGLFAGDAPMLLKYALGLPPNQPATGSLTHLRADAMDPDYPFLEYQRPEPQPEGIEYVFESSLNLTQWHAYWIHEYPHVHLTETTPGNLRVRLRSPWPGYEHPRQFLRLKILLNNPDEP